MYMSPYAALAGKGLWLKANFHVHAVPDGIGGQWTAKQLERRRQWRSRPGTAHR